MWSAIARRELDTPLEEQFLIKELSIKVPAKVRAHTGVICSHCGEGVTEERIRVREGKPWCLACAGESFFMLTHLGVSSGTDL
jgi:formylmethanofuran dehydrogenase subunit E